MIFGGIMAGYTIRNEYKSYSGRVSNISNINFSKYSDLLDFKWKLIKQSHSNSSCKFIDSGGEKVSVLVYKNPDNIKQGARIYGDYADYKYTYYNDDVLISKLQEVQPFIKLTEFPYGVITIGDKIIGQQIPFYDGYIEIGSAINKETDIEVIFNYSLKIVDIFRELYAYDVYYSDIHSGNILVNPKNNDVKLIDFEDPFVSTFKLETERCSRNKITTIKIVDLINDMYFCKCNNLIRIIPCVESLNDLKVCLLETSHKLIKK